MLWDMKQHWTMLLTFAGFDSRDTPTVYALLQCLNAYVYVVTEKSGRNGNVRRRDGRHRIALRMGLGRKARRALLAHELAEWWLCRLGFGQDDEIELAADWFQNVILCPPQAVLTVTGTMYPTNFYLVARAFGISELDAAARVAHERYLPLAALRKGNMNYCMFAGPEYAWAPTCELLELAQRLIEGSMAHPFLKAACGRDDKSLMLVWAE